MSTTPAVRTPIKYTVLEKSLIGNEMFEAGQTCLYDGLPAENLAPLCDEGRARYQEYLDSNRERAAKQRTEFADSAVGDQAAFGAAVAKAIAEANAAADLKIAALTDAMTSLATMMATLVKAQAEPAAPAAPVAHKGKAKESTDPLA